MTAATLRKQRAPSAGRGGLRHTPNSGRGRGWRPRGHAPDLSLNWPPAPATAALNPVGAGAPPPHPPAPGGAQAWEDRAPRAAYPPLVLVLLSTDVTPPFPDPERVGPPRPAHPWPLRPPRQGTDAPRQPGLQRRGPRGPDTQRCRARRRVGGGGARVGRAGAGRGLGARGLAEAPLGGGGGGHPGLRGLGGLAGGGGVGWWWRERGAAGIVGQGRPPGPRGRPRMSLRCFPYMIGPQGGRRSSARGLRGL